MTMRTVWWIILGISLFPLIATAIDFYQHRQRGARLPDVSVTLTWSGVGGMILVGSFLLAPDSTLRWIALGCCIAIQVYVFVRLRRAHVARRRAAS